MRGAQKKAHQKYINTRNTVASAIHWLVAPGGSIPDAIQPGPYRVSRITCFITILFSFFRKSWSQCTLRAPYPVSAHFPPRRELGYLFMWISISQIIKQDSM